MSDGGMMVTKSVTGVHYIEDIQVNVPHQVAVFIPANKALNSRDLHRALASKTIFQLSSSMVMQSVQPPDYDRQRQMALEQENLMLKKALEQSNKQGAELQSSVSTIEQQMKVLLETVGRMESAPRVVQTIGPGVAVASVSEAVGGDAPMFIPDDIVPTGAEEVHLQVQEQVAEEDNVSSAASRLRQLRQGKPPPTPPVGRGRSSI